MRETVKQIEFSSGEEKKTYQIHKMNALEGSYLIKFCSEKLLPAYNSIQSIFSASSIDPDLEGDELKAAEEAVAQERMEKIMTVIPEALANLTEKELMSFEIRCLQTVEVLKPAGWQPVMINGRFGDEELEYDTVSVLRLVYEVLVFNLGSFFGGGSLGSLLNSRSSSPQNA